MRRFKYFLLAALLLCLSGCQLAQPEAQTQADMLVGVMLTPEPLDLFDWEGYVGDRFGQADGEVSAADAADYAQRLYATRVDEGRWQFEGVEGFAFFAASYESESGTVSAVQNERSIEAKSVPKRTRFFGIRFTTSCATTSSTSLIAAVSFPVST